MNSKVFLFMILVFSHCKHFYCYAQAITHTFKPEINLNSLLNSFSNCLLHLTTYKLQLSSNITSSPVVNKHFPKDLVAHQEPIILSKYLEQSLSFEEYLKHSKEEDIARSTGNQTAFLFPPRVHRLPCVVQMYVLPPASVLPPNTEEFFYFFREGHSTVISPKVTNFTSTWVTDYRNAPTHFKDGVFQILVADKPDKWFKAWSFLVDDHFGGLRRETVANQFTKLVIQLSPETYELQELQLVYKDLLDYRTIQILTFSMKSWHKTSTLQELIEVKLKEIYQNTKPNWFAGSKHMGLFKFQKLAKNMMNATKDFTIHTGFRYFKSWMLSDRILLLMVFPNSTMSYDVNDTDGRRPGGEINFEDTRTPYMAFEETGFKFITCGGGERGAVSLIGYISAFDKWIWMWLAVFAFGTATAVCLFNGLVGVETKLATKISHLDCIFMPLDTVLEQGCPIYASGNGVMCISAAWFLVGVVLSNAYKGQNITDLSSPIPPIKPTKFLDLIEKNFTIYTYPHDVKNNEVDAFYDSTVNILRNGKISDIEESNPKPNILSKLIEDADPSNNVVRKYMRIHEKVYNLSTFEIVKLSRTTSYVDYLEKIKDCDNTAFMGWTEELKTSRFRLDEILFNDGRYSDKEFISTSEETLFQFTQGWTLRDITIATAEMPRRMSTMVESGIGHQWKRIEKFVRNLNLTIRADGRPRPLPTLRLNDNISVVFYVHCLLLVVTCVTLILEQCVAFFIVNSFMKFLLNHTTIGFGY